MPPDLPLTPTRPPPRHHGARQPVLALPAGLSHDELMAVDAVIGALAELPKPLGVDDDLAAIHDAERESDFAARLGKNRELREQMIVIAARALHALGRLG